MEQHIVATLFLIVMLAAIMLFLRGDRAEWRSFKALADSDARCRRYRRWTVRLWICFALPALIALLALGRVGALARMPGELRAAATMLPHLAANASELITGLATGAIVGLALVAMLARLRGGAATARLGDVSAMIPRNRAELGWTALLSLSAGITEEVAFRLVLPLLIALATGSVVAALLGAILLFGAMHLYQGWAGMLAATVAGSALTACYLATGALWVAIVLHASIDLSSLVVRPILAGVGRR